MKDIQTILITGGAGFVGSNLAMALRNDLPDVRLIAFDNLSRRGAELHLPRFQAADIDFVHGDIRHPDDLRAVGEFDLLIDCAAEPSVLAGLGSSPKPVFDINLQGTINCLEAARLSQARFLFLSTSRVYPIQTLNEVPYTETESRFEWRSDSQQIGLSTQGITEDFPLHGARSYYGASKLASELIAQEYAAEAGLPVLINRCGVLTGPWQMGKVDQGVVALWVIKHFFEQPLRYIGYGGSGRQVRDILHVHDLYQLIRKQLAAPEKWDGSVYNVGGGRDVSVSLLELTQLCEAVTGTSVEIEAVAETSRVDLRIFLTDSSRAQQDFDWKPHKSPEQIVGDLHDWIQESQQQLKPIFGVA